MAAGTREFGMCAPLPSGGYADIGVILHINDLEVRCTPGMGALAMYLAAARGKEGGGEWGELGRDQALIQQVYGSGILVSTADEVLFLARNLPTD